MSVLERHLEARLQEPPNERTGFHVVEVATDLGQIEKKTKSFLLSSAQVKFWEEGPQIQIVVFFFRYKLHPPKKKPSRHMIVDIIDFCYFCILTVFTLQEFN